MSLDRFDGGVLPGAPEKPLNLAAYSALCCLVVLALAGVIGLVAKQPWLFPSLGPTVMLFFESPRQPSSRPLNALVGHLVGIAIGFLLVLAFGLMQQPPAPVGGLTPAYVAAGALSVALTTLVLTLVKLPHPPAGASTLIVSLGILSAPQEVLVMAAAVALVVVAGWALNRLLLGRRERP
ncbi:HPP family protein [Herbiconiux sp. SYSU D00978]|uniref:HPP family protein n=1 Tax=Herbiconiux sp. SYSU D00978 TaxID=2812562 RepID=UPI001A978D3B|nr:HPP family protein [Herbiconiux sp. SYSU D00978]